MKRLIAVLMLSLAMLTGLFTTAPGSSEASDRPYLAQYRQPDNSVCIQINTSRTWLRDKVKSAEYHIDSKTDIKMWVSSDCSGNKIRIYAGYYGKNGHRAWTKLWVYSNGVIARADVYVNLSYDATGNAGTYAIRHEVAVHALLGTRHSGSCSLAYKSWSGCGVYWLTSNVIKAINWTY